MTSAELRRVEGAVPKVAAAVPVVLDFLTLLRLSSAFSTHVPRPCLETSLTYNKRTVVTTWWSS